MKKYYFLVLLFTGVFCNFSIFAQTTYTHSPTSYPSSACSSSNITGQGCFNNSKTFYGSVLKLKGTSGSKLSLTMAKCDGSTFGSTSSYYIKWGTNSNPAVLVCSQDYDEIDPSGETSYPYTLSNPGFTSETRYYILVVLGSDGARRYSNVVTVTANTSSPPSLTLWNDQGFEESNLLTGTEYQYKATIKNTGAASWNGSFLLKQGSTTWIQLYNRTIAAGKTLDISDFYTPTTPGTNLPLTLYFQTGGSGSGVVVTSGSFTNPIYVNVCQKVAQPALSSPADAFSYTSAPNSITFQWTKNNSSGVATYKLKIRDITTDPTTGPIVFERNVGDISSYNLTKDEIEGEEFLAGHTYRWVIIAIGGCNQEDDSPAWTFSIASSPSLTLWSSQGFGESNLLTGTQYPYNATIKNTGTASWNGSFLLKQGSTTWIQLYNRTIAAGQTLPISDFYTPTTPGTNLPLTLYFQTGGSGSGVVVTSGSYTNPIYVNVCQKVAQPALSSPADATSYTSAPSSITYQWTKNNASGVATYKLKIRDITTDPVNGPVIFEENLSDVSSYTHTYAYVAGKTYRWVVFAEAGCNQSDDSPAWTFSITSPPSLTLWSSQGFEESNLLTGTQYTYNATIKNTGTASWNGSFLLKQGSTTWIQLYNRTIAAGQTLPISDFYTPTTPGTNLPLTLYFQTGGSGSGVVVTSGSYTNPIYVNVCQKVAQPALSSPADATSYTSAPSSITYQWTKNNSSGVATYKLKIRDITTDPTNGPIVFERNVGDISSYNLTEDEIEGEEFLAGHTYRWVIFAIGGCNQEDDSPAWTFSIASPPSLTLWSSQGFGESNLLTGTQYPYNATIKNTSAASWNGSFLLKQGSTTWIQLYNRTIAAGQTLPISDFYTPTTPGTNLPLTLYFQTGGSGSGVVVTSGSYTNPIYVNVCQKVAQPALSSPADATSYTSAPSSITYQWTKNNASGVATYKLKIRDITTDPTNGPIVFERNVGDISSYNLTEAEIEGEEFLAGHTYRWVIIAIGGCNQEDDSPAWTFSISSPANLILNDSMSFGTNDMIVGKIYPFKTTIKNNGGSQWKGSMFLKQGSNDWIQKYNITIDADGTYDFTDNFTPSVEGNNLPVDLWYQTGGSGQGVLVPKGNYSNPIYVNICKAISQPELTSPVNSYFYSNSPSSIAFQWTKNNTSGVATYKLKIRDITTDPTNGPIVFERNVGDISSYNLTEAEIEGEEFLAGHTYRWVIIAIGGCNQEDDSPAWTFSISSPANLILNSGLSFGTNDLIVGKSFQFKTTIKNNGGSQWKGSLFLKQGSNDWIRKYNVTIEAGDNYDFNDNYTPSVVGNNLPVDLWCQTGGSGQGVLVPKGNFSNPIYVNVCKAISQPELVFPENGKEFSTVPDVIAFSWEKNNELGKATYKLKIRDITDDDDGPIVFPEQNIDDVSSYTPDISFTGGHTYRWVIIAVGDCNQEDVSTAWTFSIATQPTQPFHYLINAKDISGNQLINQYLKFKVSILKDNETGNAVYVETHYEKTNQTGLADLEIGTGMVISGSFSDLSQNSGKFYIKIEIPDTGGGYTVTYPLCFSK